MRVALLVFAGGLSVAAGCSRAGEKTTSSGSVPASAAAVGRNACDRKLLSADDMSTVLTVPITGTKAIPGDNNSTCQFTTDNLSSVTVTLRPGVGKTTVATWKSGRMPVASVPLAGVGEDAVWVAGLHEVVSQKNNLLCDIQVDASPSDLAGSRDAQSQRIGALCNKIYAAIQ
jgi:hypothetical protein